MFSTTFNILGSLGLFLFGMKMMSDALQQLSGERMRSVMQSMTGNRVKGIISGFLITSAIQSSSATTVMVVCFVNAGLLKLREAIGVIMGANLGTTATAWIIASLGFRFSLSDIAVPIVGVGTIFIMIKRLNSNFGNFLVGFGLLFVGLDFLKSAVPDMSADSAFIQWITEYSNLGFLSVLIFLIFGMVLTLLVQSSSVAVAITITMAAKGWIPLELAAAIVLGENIGTTITANLAAIPAGINAKRAAVAHTLFNVIGVCWVLIVFSYFVDMVKFIVPLVDNPTQDQMATNIAERIAMFHSMFNLCNICVLVWFVPVLEKIACTIVPRGKDSKRPSQVERIEFLSRNINDMGELVIVEGQKELVKLSNISGEMFNGFVHILQNPDKDLSSEVARLRDLEKESDELALALTNFFVKCSSQKLSQESLKQVSRNMMIIPELEAMCDACYRLITFARKRYRRQLSDSILQSSAFVQLCDEMSKFVRFMNKSLENDETLTASLEGFITIRESLSLVRKSLRKEAIAQMESGGVTQGGILFIEMLSACGRVNAHALNVLEAMSIH